MRRSRSQLVRVTIIPSSSAAVDDRQSAAASTGTHHRDTKTREIESWVRRKRGRSCVPCLPAWEGQLACRRWARGTVLLLSAMALVLGSLASAPQARAQDNGQGARPSKAPPSLRVVKLLWKTQPKSAASALEKAIDQAMTRDELDQLRPHLRPLDSLLKESLSDPEDVRWMVSVAAVALYDQKAAARWMELGVSGFQRDGKGRQADLPLAQRDFLLRVWLETQPEASRAFVRSQLADAPSS